jgi:hypothetical protein
VKYALVVIFALVPALTWGGPGLTEKEAHKTEQTLAAWLSHPMEFGERPKTIRYLTSIETRIAGTSGPVSVHVVEFWMTDGTYGKGFVNPITWSFAGKLPYDRLTNEQLVLAYSGCVWLMSAQSSNPKISEFKPTTLGAFIASLQSRSVADISIRNQYRVGDSEFFEFIGTKDGVPVKGAGSLESQMIVEASAPEASLPLVYTFLGKVMRDEL